MRMWHVHHNPRLFTPMHHYTLLLEESWPNPAFQRTKQSHCSCKLCVSIPVDRGCCKLCSATWLQIGQVPNKKVSSTTGAILENKIVLLCIIDIAILIYTYSSYYVFGVWGALLMPFLGVDLLMAGDRWEPMARKWVESSRGQRNLVLCGIYVYIYIIVLGRGIIPK